MEERVFAHQGDAENLGLARPTVGVDPNIAVTRGQSETRSVDRNRTGAGLRPIAARNAPGREVSDVGVKPETAIGIDVIWIMGVMPRRSSVFEAIAPGRFGQDLLDS
jgi:hypothetical protein